MLLVGRWDKLEELRLTDNQWSCDCRNQYLVSSDNRETRELSGERKKWVKKLARLNRMATVNGLSLADRDRVAGIRRHRNGRRGRRAHLFHAVGTQREDARVLGWSTSTLLGSLGCETGERRRDTRGSADRCTRRDPDRHGVLRPLATRLLLLRIARSCYLLPCFLQTRIQRWWHLTTIYIFFNSVARLCSLLLLFQH